jgi:hypothetical protein
MDRQSSSGSGGGRDRDPVRVANRNPRLTAIVVELQMCFSSFLLGVLVIL